MKSHGGLVLLVTLGVPAVASHAAAQGYQTPGLVIERTEVVGTQVFVTARNVGTRTITAWSVRGFASYETGEPQSIEMAADGAITGFMVPDGPSFALRPFEPGVVLTRNCGIELRHVPVKAVSLVPTAVVFADGSSAGDEQIIRMIFASRARERRALHTIARILSDVRTSAESLDASALITEAQTQLVAAGQDGELRESAPYKNFVGNLTIANNMFVRDPTKLRARFTQLGDDARRRRALADQHYQRR